MGAEHLTYSEYGARQPTSDYEAELPLSLYTEDANVLITDANGVEIVPFMPQDFIEGPGVEMVPPMVRALKKYYETPEVLVAAEADHLKGRLVYGDDDGEEDIWFEPEALPSEPAVDNETVDSHVPFELVVDDDADWPDDVGTKPDHEIRIEDIEDNFWYRADTATCDAMYTETPEIAVANAADLIEAVRLAYERPDVFIARYRES